MEKNNNLLFIDDEEKIVSSLKRFLRKDDYNLFTATSGEEGLEVLKKNEIGVVVSDLQMPGMNGLKFFETISKEYQDTAKILLTGNATLDSTLDAINSLRLFGYLKKPWPADELKAIISRAFDHYNLIVDNKRLLNITKQQNDTLAERTAQLEKALRDSIMMVALAAEAKDPDIIGHMNRIQGMVLDICNGADMAIDDAEKISFFSAIHDVGNSHVSDRILYKTGALSDDEWNEIKNHTIAGERILGEKKFYTMARQIARSHHENWDGTGYPDGLKGEEIPIAARVVAIADVFDALMHKRPYRDAFEKNDALDEMDGLSGKKFDPKLLEVFLKLATESD